jgi:hypothetical protein
VKGHIANREATLQLNTQELSNQDFSSETLRRRTCVYHFDPETTLSVSL